MSPIALSSVLVSFVVNTLADLGMTVFTSTARILGPGGVLIKRVYCSGLSVIWNEMNELLGAFVMARRASNLVRLVEKQQKFFSFTRLWITK